MTRMGFLRRPRRDRHQYTTLSCAKLPCSCGRLHQSKHQVYGWCDGNWEDQTPGHGGLVPAPKPVQGAMQLAAKAICERAEVQQSAAATRS